MEHIGRVGRWKIDQTFCCLNLSSPVQCELLPDVRYPDNGPKFVSSEAEVGGRDEVAVGNTGRGRSQITDVSWRCSTAVALINCCGMCGDLIAEMSVWRGVAVGTCRPPMGGRPPPPLSHRHRLISE